MQHIKNDKFDRFFIFSISSLDASFNLNKLLISRELFADIKYKKLRPSNDIERASFYLFLLTQSFGSKGKNF